MSYEVRTDLQWNGQDVKIRGKRVVNKTAFETGLIVEGQAKALCPRKTGRLAASITTQSSTRGTEMDGAKGQEGSDKISPPRDDQEVFVGTAVDYGPYVEFGALTRPSQPFLRPALDLATGKVIPITQKNAKMEFAEYLNPRAT